jgi:hypothetical protein
MPNTVRTTNANGNGARDLQEKPLQSSAKNPTCQGGALVPNSPPKPLASLSVRPDGREVFLPPLDPGRLYEITVHGIYEYLWSEYKYVFFRTPKKKAFDALYMADDLGNFVQKHDWLSFDGLSLRHYLKKVEDRAAHKYKFRISGRAERISARLYFSGATLPKVLIVGALTIVVDLLPDGAPSPSHFIGREDEGLLEKRQKETAKTKAARERTAAESEFAALRCQAHRESYFLNPDFQQKFARHHLEEISSELKEDWASEYDYLMQRPQFKRRAAKYAPEVLAWLEARVNIVRLAEEVIVSSSALQSQKKPKLTADQVRALKVRRDGIQAEDRIARTKLKAEKLLKGRAELESIPLDPDVKQSLSTELDQEILDIGEEEKNNGKSGTTL